MYPSYSLSLSLVNFRSLLPSKNRKIAITIGRRFWLCYGRQKHITPATLALINQVGHEKPLFMRGEATDKIVLLNTSPGTVKFAIVLCYVPAYINVACGAGGSGGGGGVGGGFRCNNIKITTAVSGFMI